MVSLKLDFYNVVAAFQINEDMAHNAKKIVRKQNGI